MKKAIKFLLLVICFILLISCRKNDKEYVIFNYHCEGKTYKKCEIVNNKINCDMSNPTCEGYDFIGWYKLNETEEVDLSSNFSNNTILHAKWKENSEIEEPSSQQIPIEEPSSQIEEPSSSQKPLEEPSSQSKLEEKKYTLSFNLNGGSGTKPTSVNLKYNANLPTISTTKPARSGYTFMGWYDNTDYTNGVQYYNASNAPVRKYDKKSNITLYAGWKLETYKISFNVNGGTGGQTTALNVTYNGNLPTISTTKPARSGYTFMGWYDNTNYTSGVQYYNASNVPVRKYDKKSNITLYAGWKKNELTIQYNGNGGKWISTSTTYTVDKNGTVIIKSSGQPYKEVKKYGESLPSSGLTDYNGSWFNWDKEGYIAKSGKEYFVQNESIKTEINQEKAYTAIELAKYGGCDLSKKDCLITVKVNWNTISNILKNINIIYTGDSRTSAYNSIKKELGFDDSKETIYARYGTQYDDYFKSHLNSAKNQISENSIKTFAVTFNYGVNDVKKYKNFCDYYDNYIKSIDKKNRFYIISVTPVNGNPWINNTDIENFNNYMKNTCISQIKRSTSNSHVYYCDIYNKIPMQKWLEYIISPNENDKTGAHYTTEGSKFIYQSIKECIAYNE